MSLSHMVILGTVVARNTEVYTEHILTQKLCNSPKQKKHASSYCNSAINNTKYRITGFEL